MRLINTSTLELEEFPGLVPKYAILSHTWDQEVSLQDWREAHKLGNIPNLYTSLSRTKLCVLTPAGDTTTSSSSPIAPIGHASTWPSTSPDNHAHNSLGFHKIVFAALRARADDLAYLWVDTCCIDKTSSAELSEAINSMYAWYRNSTVCYAYLSDVPPNLNPSDLTPPSSPFRRSRWFKRGWTLQELLAPKSLIFYSSDWAEIGTKIGLAELVSDITKIDTKYLRRTRHITGASVAHRMSWVSDRTTTRPEDVAYCLLGIFDVHLPLIYGEGSRAFVRLQEEIIRMSDDHSIFAWTWVGELSGPLMRGDRRNRGETAERMRRAVKDVARKDGFPVFRLGELMANTLWQDPLRSTLLAPDPICFFEAGGWKVLRPGGDVRPFAMTNAGLTMELPLIAHVDGDLVFAVLHEEVDERKGRSEVVVVPLVRHHEHRQRYTRTWFPPGPVRIVREGRLGIEPTGLSVVRDVQHARFYYPGGFGGTGHKFGFWLTVNGEGRGGWSFAGGYAPANGVFNSYGVFLDVPEVQEAGPAGGLLVFDGPNRVIVVFLALTLVRVKTAETDRVEVRHHCEVTSSLRWSRSQVLQQRGIESLYQTLRRKHQDSPSTRTAQGQGCRVWIRNDWPASHVEDARIAMTEIRFPSALQL